MSEPTVPTPAASEGWPPRVPTNPEPVSYPSTGGGSAYPTPAPSYQQFYVAKPAEVIEGEQLAKTSTIFGIISLFFAGVILGPMAIIKAAKAEKLGVDSTVGKVTGWLGTIIAALTIILTIVYLFIAAAVLSGLESKASGIKTGGISNSQDYGEPNTYENAKRQAAEGYKQSDRLTQVAKDAAEQIK